MTSSSVRPFESVHPFEKVVLACVAAALVAGVVGAWIDGQWFERVYAAEDGPVEWASAASLLVAAGVAAWTAAHPASGRRGLHTLTWAGLAVLCLFAAGEEISWGQRIFGWSSPEYFLEHNAQSETNLHNLVVGGVKVNKLVFSQLFVAGAALFLLVLPVLHRRSAAFARLVDRLGVPVPRLRQVIAIGAAFALIGLVSSRKRDELLELGATAIFMLILLFPRNVAAIRAARRGEASDLPAPAARPPAAAAGGAPGARAPRGRP